MLGRAEVASFLGESADPAVDEELGGTGRDWGAVTVWRSGDRIRRHDEDDD